MVARVLALLALSLAHLTPGITLWGELHRGLRGLESNLSPNLLSYGDSLGCKMLGCWVAGILRQSGNWEVRGAEGTMFLLLPHSVGSGIIQRCD